MSDRQGAGGNTEQLLEYLGTDIQARTLELLKAGWAAKKTFIFFNNAYRNNWISWRERLVAKIQKGKRYNNRNIEHPTHRRHVVCVVAVKALSVPVFCVCSDLCKVNSSDYLDTWIYIGIALKYSKQPNVFLNVDSSFSLAWPSWPSQSSSFHVHMCVCMFVPSPWNLFLGLSLANTCHMITS